MIEVKQSNLAETYVTPDGRLTIEGQKLFQQWVAFMEQTKAAIEGIAAVSDPTGGGTVDSQARTAIIAIIDAAG